MARASHDDTVYVAVGKDFEESKLTVLWALQNLQARNVCILHVHQPAEMISLVGGNFPASELEEYELRAIKGIERKIMHKTLDDYRDICVRAGVIAEKLYIDMHDIGEGIVELIYQHSVKKLVMGAAADKHYSERMVDIRSMKAKHVRQHVPYTCQTWFICRGHLILTWNGHERESNGFQVDHYEPASTSTRVENVDDRIYEQLEQALAEAEKSKQEAFEESIRRIRAEKSAIEAIRRARTLEIMYNDELRFRKEIEEELAEEREDLQKLKQERDEERLIAMDQKLLMESQVASSDYMMKQLNDELASALGLSETYKKERDDLQEEFDNALKVTEELLKKQAEEDSSLHMQQFFSEFSVSEIQEATDNFHPSLKTGEGSYGSLYKGSLRHTPVSIRVLHSNRLHGPSEFQLEVDISSKLRHPNLVTLIGVCPEIWALIYEYLPSGSLEDRLSCQNNTPPLSWQTRIRIATELCSILIFLHSRNSDGFVHSDLKAGNIFLDAHFVCKLTTFGIRRVYAFQESLGNMTSSHRTDPSSSSPYVDPQLLQEGELSPKSDIYSFGIILLQLLTGRSPLGIAEEMQDAIDEGNLETILDPLAGDWPIGQATRLAHLALRCCQINHDNRPDLEMDVWTVLESVRASFESPSSWHPVSEEQGQPPSYFICPILQEVMQDPCVAADGFTYEGEALRGWFDSGHDTSPMTNLRLQHCNLVPNRALRSAIQDWLQQH